MSVETVRVMVDSIEYDVRVEDKGHHVWEAFRVSDGVSVCRYLFDATGMPVSHTYNPEKLDTETIEAIGQAARRARTP